MNAQTQPVSLLPAITLCDDTLRVSVGASRGCVDVCATLYDRHRASGFYVSLPSVAPSTARELAAALIRQADAIDRSATPRAAAFVGGVW